MSTLAVTISREVKHWRIEAQIQGDVEPSTIFACRDGFSPILRCLVAAEAEMNAIETFTQRAPGDTPTLITVRMPSGRVLSFRIAPGQ